MRVTFVPGVDEHARGVAALDVAGARVFDRAAALPLLLAALIAAGAVHSVAGHGGPPTFEEVLPLMGAFLFFTGVALRGRWMRRDPLTYEFGEDGIEVRQPRHRWTLSWSRVRRVEETPEFFAIVADGVALYLPRRALAGAETDFRRLLAARGLWEN